MLHLTAICPDLDIARDIARAALRDGLATAASVQTGRIGVFHLHDQIRESPEVGLDLLTTPQALHAVIALIQARHPDDRPTIRWHDVQTADQPRNWLADAPAR